MLLAPSTLVGARPRPSTVREPRPPKYRGMAALGFSGDGREALAGRRPHRKLVYGAGADGRNTQRCARPCGHRLRTAAELGGPLPWTGPVDELLDERATHPTERQT